MEILASNAALAGSRTCTFPDPVRISHAPVIDPFGGNVAAARIRTQTALNPANRNIAGAGMQINVARSGFFEFNVAAASAAANRA